MKVQEPTVDKESKNLQLYKCAHITLDKNDHNVQETVPEVQKKSNSSSMRLEPKTLETYMTCYDPQLQGYFM